MPGITYTLGAENAQLIRAMEQASTAVQGAFGKITAALGAMGISFAAFRGGEEFIAGIAHVADMGKELKTMSTITGASITDLVVMRKAFKEVGLDADGVQGALVRMQKALGGVNEEGQPTSHIFTQLHLNVRDLVTKSALEQMQALGGAIGKLGNDSLKTNAAMQIFGRGGAEMKALFADPKAMEEAAKSMGAIGDIYQRNGENFRHLSNTMESLKGRVSGFFVGFTDQITPVILPMLDKLKASMNFVGVGEKAGEVFRVVAAGFEHGGLGDLIGLSLQKASMEFANGLIGAGGALGAVILGVIRPFADNFTAVVVSFGDLLTGAVESMGVVLLEVFEKPIVALQAGIEYAMQTMMEQLGKMPVLGDMLGLSGMHAQSYDEIYQEHQAAGANLAGFNSAQIAADAVERMTRGKDALSAIGSQVDLKPAMQEAADTFHGAMNGDGPFDTKAISDKLGEAYAGLTEVANQLTPKAQEAASAANNNVAAPASSLPVGKVDTLSDRLSKIGLFIGGAGGPRGEKAAMDTAANTAKTAEHLATLVPAVQQMTTSVLTSIGRFSG